MYRHAGQIERHKQKSRRQQSEVGGAREEDLIVLQRRRQQARHIVLQNAGNDYGADELDEGQF